MPKTKQRKTTTLTASARSKRSAARAHRARPGHQARAGDAGGRPASAVLPAATEPVVVSAAAPRQTKKAMITALLQRPDGAAVTELMAATGWRAHSVRAALTGLRRDGRAVDRSRDANGINHYRIARGS
jgi:hypothetical protein